MIEVRNDACIRVSSELNDWIDCIFIVDKSDVEEAEKVLQKAWNDYWEDDDGWCFGDFLETRMESSGIPFMSYYGSIKEEE